MLILNLYKVLQMNFFYLLICYWSETFFINKFRIKVDIKHLKIILNYTGCSKNNRCNHINAFLLFSDKDASDAWRNFLHNCNCILVRFGDLGDNYDSSSSFEIFDLNTHSQLVWRMQMHHRTVTIFYFAQ